MTKAARVISPAKRFLRAQCEGLEERQAKAWLVEFAPVIRILVGKYRHAIEYISGFDQDDLVPIAQMAVLEACLTFNPNASGTLRTWVGNIVRWRLAAAISSAQDETMLVYGDLYHAVSGSGGNSHTADQLPQEAAAVGGNIEEQLDIRREFRDFEALRAAGETDVEVLAEAFEAGWTEEGVAALAEELRPRRRRRLVAVK